jgi:hypothetical protein
MTRVDPRLSDPPHACCPDGCPGNGYEALTDDPRIVTRYAATEAIATALLHCASPRHTEAATSALHQMATASSSNATASRRVAGSSAASS